MRAREAAVAAGRMAWMARSMVAECAFVGRWTRQTVSNSLQVPRTIPEPFTVGILLESVQVSTSGMLNHLFLFCTMLLLILVSGTLIRTHVYSEIRKLEGRLQ